MCTVLQHSDFHQLYSPGEFQGFKTRNDFNNGENHPCMSPENNCCLEEYGNISRQQPRYPQFAIKTIRITSYRNFPAGKSQTQEELAEAGLFYSGKDDLVYCFFCGQGLKSWEPEDEPWIEHAKWSPKCKFVHDVHGKDFVTKIQNSKSNSKEIQDLIKTLRGNRKTKEQKPKDNKPRCKPSRSLLETNAARSLLIRNYSIDTVWKLINVFIKLHDTDTFSGKDLLKTAFALEDGEIEDIDIQDESETSTGSQQKHKSEKLETATNGDKDEIFVKDDDKCKTTEETAMPCADMDLNAIASENEQLRKATLCKVCLDEHVSVVFLPCGHLVCCGQCGSAVRKCPLCRTFIKGTVKAFLS